MSNFTKIDNIVLSDKTLSPMQKMIYVALSSYADNKTRSCYPSYNTLAEKAGCSRRTAILAMKVLIEKEYVVKVQKLDERKNAHACNLYILATTEALPTKTKPTKKEDSNEVEIKSNVTSITDKLASVRQAFPQANNLLDVIEEHHTNNKYSRNQIPSESIAPPSEPTAPELYSLNYTQSNYHSTERSERSEYGNRDEILRKLDEHFDYDYFAHDQELRTRYTMITGYIAEMLIDDQTKIRNHAISRDEIARMVFSADTGTMRSFLDYLEKQVLTLSMTKIHNTQAYFKTVFIEFLREGSLIYGQC